MSNPVAGTTAAVKGTFTELEIGEPLELTPDTVKLKEVAGSLTVVATATVVPSADGVRVVSGSSLAQAGMLPGWSDDPGGTGVSVNVPVWPFTIPVIAIDSPNCEMVKPEAGGGSSSSSICRMV